MLVLMFPLSGVVQGGGSGSTPGIVQIATQDLFRLIQEKTDRMFLMRVSYLEIYQEEIRDLLNPDNTNMQARVSVCVVGVVVALTNFWCAESSASDEDREHAQTSPHGQTVEHFVFALVHFFLRRGQGVAI